MELKIEAASIKHLDTFYKIELQCFKEEAFAKQQIAYLLTDFNTIALEARADNEIAGFIIAQIEYEDREYGHILTLNIAPDYRKKGIGTKLLSEVERYLKQRGVGECRIEVREDNHAAIKLYHKLGYHTVGKLELYYGKKHGFYLKKTL